MSAGDGQATELPALTPLQMAQKAARNVLAYADAQECDPLGAHVTGAGKTVITTAQVAGNMALVSIAESLAELVVLVQREVSPDARE